METFLTCHKLIEKLRKTILNEETCHFLQESSVNSIYKTLLTGVSISDLKLLFTELPSILNLNFPVVKDIRLYCINIIPQLINFFRVNHSLNDIAHFEHLYNMLKTFDSYEHT